MNNTVFVVSEFNPFHCGHEYLIKELHKAFETVVCVMSSSSVQRGEIAVCDKYTRAKTAILGGADLVFELPFPYCSLSARDFAYSAVSIVNDLCGESLGFGIEDDEEKLKKAALVIQSDKAAELIRKSPNLSYPKAVTELYEQETGENGEFIAMPNNILGIEYFRAVAEINKSIIPFTVRRDRRYYSSGEIRSCLSEDRQYGLSILPDYTAEAIKNDIRNTGFLDTAFIASLRMGKKHNIYGIDSGTYSRICNYAQASNTINELCTKASSSGLTNARIRRTALLNYFGVTDGYAHKKPSYTVLLAASSKGCEYISANKKRFAIPVITKPADYTTLGSRVIEDFELAVKSESVIMLADRKGRQELMKATPFIKSQD